MTKDISQVFEGWVQSALEERGEAYKYVGLRPIKKAPTYKLILSPFASIEEFTTEIISEVSKASSGFIAKTYNYDSNHQGFTAYAPPNRRKPKKKPATKPVEPPKSSLSLEFMKNQRHIEHAVVLTFVTQKGIRELQAHILKPKHLIVRLTISDTTVKKEIEESIIHQKPLSSKNFNLIAQALAGQGYHIVDNSLLRRIEKAGEVTRVWGQPLLKKDEVNFLNAYQSWYDFFNDIKALFVKPVTIFLKAINHAFHFFWKIILGCSHMFRGQTGAVEDFEKAMQSLLKVIIYGALSYYYLVAIAQGLSIMMRMLITIPGLLLQVPDAINACTQRGTMRVVGEGLSSFATGFCSMFSTRPIPGNEAVSAPRRAASQTTQRPVSQPAEVLDQEQLRTLRVNRFGGSNSE